MDAADPGEAAGEHPAEEFHRISAIFKLKKRERLHSVNKELNRLMKSVPVPPYIDPALRMDSSYWEVASVQERLCQTECDIKYLKRV